MIREAIVPKGEKVICPNCNGTGTDKSTMFCCMCGGDGILSGEDITEEWDVGGHKITMHKKGGEKDV